MIHTHDVLRERLLARAGLHPIMNYCADYKELWESEWSRTFERLRRERMVVGSYRYGRASQYRGRRRNLCARAIRRIGLYVESGNTEYLLDAANLLMIEFEWEPNPKKHLRTIHEGHDRSRL